MRFQVLCAFAMLALTCGCNDGDVGDDCDTPGSEDECVDEAVCDRREDGAVVCLARCTNQADCSSDENCNGITDSSIKACHPKK